MNNSATWENANHSSVKLDSGTKDQELKSGGLVKNFLKKSFWTLIALLNILIFGDIIINGGNNLIDLFFVLTGGFAR